MASDVMTIEAAALALYRVDHPAYQGEDMGDVPLLETVLAYRERARAAFVVFEQAQAEPEYEYGTAYQNPDGTVWDEFSWGADIDGARAEVADSDNGYGEGALVLVSRTRAVPAGPWELVTDE